MATVNFSVPDWVKAEFDRTFQGQNKSAVIAGLMQEAVERVALKKRRQALFEQLTAKRPQRGTADDKDIKAARQAGRS